jgi:LmbE family N-acetylglucosaminyl deacetylase
MLVRTLLAIHAHPDDETITMGGTLARYSAEGVRTIVVTCTTGALGDVHDQTLLAEGDVAALRDRELTAATVRLGVARVVRLGYADSGMDGWPENYAPKAFFVADLQLAACQLAELIDQEQPQVVVSYDQTGGYGHPDHIKTHLATLAAVKSSHAARAAKLYYVRFPLSWSRTFVRELRAAGIDAPSSAPTGADAGPTLAEIGVPDQLVTTRIDVRPFVADKRAALALHASQMPPDSFLMRMPLELGARLWAYEYYSLEAGPIAAPPPGEYETDFFAGLR